jgi:Zn-dependent metalloprotease
MQHVPRPTKIAKERMTTVHKCHCEFIPPNVLGNLAAAGIDAAALSSQQSTLSRKKREARVKDMEEFVSLASVGKAGRKVYDCKHQWKQRIKLVRKEGQAKIGDASTDKAYSYAGIVRDYYKKVLNRNSIDNADMDLILNVHYGDKYQNAFWDGDEMTFGDGDGEIFVNFTGSLDVIAHELAHGVTQWEANLEYDGQSGALNEHFSDVFGTVITQYFEKQTADTADWLIGDEIMGPRLKGEALRSMSEPGTAFDNELMGKDRQPSHMKDYYQLSDDNHGVHINSGILNKAFYLTAKDIETDKAGLIWYTALQNLWPTVLFNSAVKIIVRSAGDLAEAGQVPKGSPQVVRSAFKAVGLPS